MVSVGVDDCESFGPKRFPQLMNGQGDPVEVTTATEEIGAGMMISVARKDKSVIYLLGPYLLGGPYRCGRGKERSLIVSCLFYVFNHLESVDLAENFGGNWSQVEGR